jgi:thiol-disulfide isomerase/thioredoxin
MDNNKPGLKYLIRINSFKKLFNECLNNDDINCAYMILYKMRSLHGHVLCSYNNIINQPKKHLFNISCYNSICSIINDTIINSETEINQFIKDNNIDVSKIEDKNEEQLSIDYISSDEKTNKPSEKNISNNLPLFNGEYDKNKLKKKNIESDIKTKSLNDYTNNLPSLILFYKQGCPACENTKPEWNILINKFLSKFEDENKLFNIIEIDIADRSNNTISTLFDIEYVPTIIMMESTKLENSNIEKIVGMADKNRIYNFIKESYQKFNK